MSAQLREAAQYALQVLSIGSGKQARLRAIQMLKAGLQATDAAHPPAELSGRPLEWEMTHADMWTDKHHGFCILIEPDEADAYSASWGEGDAEQFKTLELAMAWCQRQLDAWVRRFVIATPASAPPAASGGEVVTQCAHPRCLTAAGCQGPCRSAAASAPAGWVFRRNDDHSLTITGPRGEGVVVHRETIGPREIPEKVLYALASDMLATPAHPQEAAHG